MIQVLFKERIPGLKVEQVIRDDEFSMDIRHMHSEYEIYYLVEGERYYFIESETFLIRPGTLIFVDKEKIHKTSMAGRPYFNRILIELKEDWLETFFQEFRVITKQQFFQYYREVVLDEEGKSLVEELLRSIAWEAGKRKVGYEQMIRARLTEMMLYVIRFKQMEHGAVAEREVSSGKHNKVNEVAEYIREHYTENLTLEDLSGRFYVSKCYLSRIFKEITSFTVNEYITVQRIKKGRELLEQSDFNITRISELAGFDSITYFEKVFKKHMGQTPRQYRQVRSVKGE